MSTTGSSPSRAWRADKHWSAVLLAVVAGVTLVTAPLAQAQGDEDGDDGSSVSLAPLDPLMEDTVVPDVFVPVGDAAAPVGNNTQGLLFDDNYHAIPPPPFGPNLWLSNIAGGVPTTAADLVLDATADEPRDAARYRIEVVWSATPPTFENNSITARGTEGVPRPLDLSGDGVYDISVEVRDITTTPTLRVTRLPGAPLPLSAHVLVVLYPFGPSAPDAVTLRLGASEFPGLSTITLTDPGFESGQLVANVRTVEPGDLLRVAARYRFGPDQDDVIEVSEVLSPVPEEITLTS